MSKPILQRGRFNGVDIFRVLSAEADEIERVRLFTKLMSAYPHRAANEDMTLETLISESRDIPTAFLSMGLKTISREPGRKWLPTPNEIRDASAKAVAKVLKLIPAQPVYNAWAETPELHVEATIKRVRQWLPIETRDALNQGELPLDGRVKALASGVST